MNETRSSAPVRSLLAAAFLAAGTFGFATAQDTGDGSSTVTAPVFQFGGGGRWGVGEEARRRPPLMPWQRTLEDALALSRATGKPLLVCVNTDGEPASESLAWNRYRDPEFVALARGFIPVIASPNRREKRERDDRGRRLPDARFGRLINSEHIDIEPLLYERYFDGRRVAPRHVGVSPDGEILFDLYLLQDLRAVDEALRAHGVFGPAPADPVTLGEDVLLASPDAALRTELERRFLVSDERTRTRLAGLALSAVRETQHPELLLLALRDPSDAVRRQAVWTIIEHPAHAPLAHLPAAFALVGDDAEWRRTFVAALRKTVATAGTPERADNAAFYLRVYSALHEPSAHVDPARWRLALALATPATAAAPTGDDFEATVAVLEALETALAQHPEDVELLVQNAAARMRFARVKLATGDNPLFFFQDVITAARETLAVAPEEGRALGYLAWAHYMINDLEAAGEMAARAVPRLLRDAGSPLAAEVLNVLATVRTRTLYEAMAAGEAWPANTLPDAIAAYEVLLAHPAGTEAHWRAYLDLLGGLRAYGAQGALLRRAIVRFPRSGDLHNYLRFQALRDGGAWALERVYEAPFLAPVRKAHGPALDWFQGLATLVAAEQDLTNRDAAAALAAYRRCDEQFARAAQAAPDFAGSAAHYQCLARAGAAQLLADEGRYAEAVDAIVEAVRIAPGSASMPDGLGRTPADIARGLRRTLAQHADPALGRELERRLAEVGLEFPSPSGPRTDG